MSTERIKREIGGETRWCVRGEHGAVDFHFMDLTGLDRGPAWVSAGLEFHRRTPAAYQEGRGPDFAECWLLDGPCWCDGTSLYAAEQIYPVYRDRGEDALWQRLEREYAEMVERDAVEASEAAHP